MTLANLLDRYTAAVACSPRYLQSLRRTVRKANDSGLEKICQLNPENVNNFLASLTVGQTTKHNIRRELMTLWRHAFDCGLTEVYPLRVRKIRPAYKPAVTWTIGQLEMMLDAAERDETPISRNVNLRRCDVLPCWMGIAYDTGLRFSDIHNLRACDFRNGCVAITASKTGKPVVRPMSELTQLDTARLLARSPDGTLFRWFLCRRRAFYLWRAFLDGHKFFGSSQWFRRACATQKENEERGSAQRYLQHDSPRLTQVHYIDQSQLRLESLPPPIRKPR